MHMHYQLDRPFGFYVNTRGKLSTCTYTNPSPGTCMFDDYDHDDNQKEN